MGGLFSLLSVARDGIVAQTAALDVTSQNVSGANTPGYVKRTPQLQTVTGGSVQMTGATRSFDSFSYSQLVDQESRLASATARSGALTDIETTVSPSTDDIGARADKLFNAFHDLALNPSDPAVRSSVLASAQWLASGFSETADSLGKYQGQLLAQSTSVVGEVNSRLNDLASVDKNITEAAGRGDDVADLRDRRDQLVREISQRVGARAVESPNGGITLFSGGTVLYESGRAASLSVQLDTSGKMQFQANRDGNVIDVTKGIQTGTLAGVQEARDVDIPGVLSKLDQFAKDISDTTNSIQAAGYGLDGGTGRPLFTQLATADGAAHAMSVDASIVDHPEFIAASSTPGDVPGGSDVAGQLANLSLVNLGAGGTTSERYATIASSVGLLKSASDSEQSMRQDTVATASALRESASGVSTDEEMIHLQQYQRAFDASSRVLKTVSDLFDTLMQAI